ncbi:MAG TPA: LemA family protein [Blastocatellia bacterium]|nr:LemA family protein [Blastocatellia bacterium]
MSNRFEQQTDEKAQFRQEYATQQGQLQTQTKKRSMGLIIGGVVLALLLIWGIASYNSLTGQREEVRQYFSNIDTELLNRAELIPNLVEVVKGVTKQEQAVFGEIANARSRLINPQATPNQKIEADNQMSGALSRLLALQESYPELKSNQNFLKLQDTVEGTNRRIVVGRRDYNQKATGYNTSRQSFPKVLIAGILGFDRAELFQADEGSRKNPDIKF